MIPARGHRLAYLGGILLIARRDLRSVLLSPWAYTLMAVLVALLGAGAIAGMPRGSGASTAVADYARYGYYFYVTYLYAIALIVVPALASIAVAGERKGNTFDQLRLCSLSCGQIVLGKAATILLLYLLLCSATLPLAGMVYFFAGVEFGTMLLLPAQVVPFATFTATTGIFTALRWHDVYSDTTKPTGMAIVFGLVPSLYIGAAFQGGPNWSFNLAAAAPCFLLCAMFFFLLARRELRVEEHRPGIPEPAPPPIRKGRQLSAMEPHWSKRKQPIRDAENPVHAKELWSHPLFDGVHAGPLLIVGFLAGIAVAMPAVDRGSNAAFLLSLGRVSTLLVLSMVPALVVHLFNRERESDTLLQLQSTPLTAVEVLWGKASAVIRALIPLFIGVIFMELVAAFAISSGTSANDYLSELSASLLRVSSRLPLYLLLVACCTLPGALIARNSLSAHFAGYGGAVLGALLIEWIRWPLVSYVATAASNRGRLSATEILLVTVQDAALLTLLGAGAFALACRLYRRV